MKVKLFSSVLCVCLFSSMLWFSCKKHDDDVSVPEASEVNKFVWNNMKDYYLWTDNVSNLSNPEFNQEEKLNAFLNSYTDPEALFNDLLYQKDVVDKWSFIVSDYETLEDWFSGISESMGFDFHLDYLDRSSNNNLFGYVRYVLPDSPASRAGLKRGDVFWGVNNTQLNTDNVEQYLYSPGTFTLNMAKIENNIVSHIDKSVTMSTAVIHENPIFFHSVLDIGGTKIGYLVYNSFTDVDDQLRVSYDIQLNQVFGDFKSQGIQKLILDLRYNSGGIVQSALYLGSMIYSTDATKIFMKTQFNTFYLRELVEEYGPDVVNEYFTNVIDPTDYSLETQVNSLNLTQLHVITSKYTASASEMLINGLDPYINVRLIGSNTAGKNVGSTLIKHEDENGNELSKWAIQPIVQKMANSVNFSDYTNGLPPDVSIVENPANLSTLGDPSEPLLKAALDDIRGVNPSVAQVAPVSSSFRSFGGRRDLIPFSMYDNRRILKRNKIVSTK